MAVALLALVLALGSSAVAAKFGPFKGDKIIRNKSLSGKKLKNHTITSAQVDLGRLGKVPSASSADTAGNANALGGVAPSGYQGHVMWALISPTGTVVLQSGGISVEAHPGSGIYDLAFPARVQGKAISVTPGAGPAVTGQASPCGGAAAGPDSIDCGNGSNTANDLNAVTFFGGAATNAPFYVVVYP